MNGAGLVRGLNAKIQKRSRVQNIGGIRKSREKLYSWLKDD